MTTRRGDRGGFVLAFVVFMLFAVSVASATGYLVVASEFTLAKHSGDGAEALAVARSGLERFIAEELGVVADSASYALGDGVATVSTRKLFEADSVTDYYYVRSEGTVADIFTPNTPAVRTVGAYAIHRKRPLAHWASVMISTNTLTASDDLHGDDYNSSGDCPGGGATSITAGIANNSVVEGSGGDLDGNPDSEIWSGGYTAMLDSIGLRWEVLSDPDLPVDFDGVWPNFSSLPSDSFPVIRRYGWLYTNVDGRGVLIVDGMFDPGPSFEWEGIVLAAHVDDIIQGDVRGIVVGGLDANNFYNSVQLLGDHRYYSCNVYKANDSLSYLELVENSIVEIN